MWRTAAILTTCVCAVAGCRGGAAQEPYDGMVARARRPADSVAVPPRQAPEAAPIASEADVPWTIALLSNAKSVPVKKPGRVIVVETEPDLEPSEATAEEADVHFAVDRAPTEERLTTPKTCNGVVKTRS
jgi:glucose/arabinose dehydrogenase